MKRFPQYHSFPPHQHLPSPPPPPPRLQWQTLCITGSCHVDVSVIKHACKLKLFVTFMSDTWNSFEKLILLKLELSYRCSFWFLALRSVLRQEAYMEFSPELRVWEDCHTLRLSVNSLHHLSISAWQDMHHCHSYNSLPLPTERGEENGGSWLPSKLVNILVRMKCISAFGGLTFSLPSVSAWMWPHNEMI